MSAFRMPHTRLFKADSAQLTRSNELAAGSLATNTKSACTSARATDSPAQRLAPDRSASPEPDRGNSQPRTVRKERAEDKAGASFCSHAAHSAQTLHTPVGLSQAGQASRPGEPLNWYAPDWYPATPTLQGAARGFNAQQDTVTMTALMRCSSCHVNGGKARGCRKPKVLEQLIRRHTCIGPLSHAGKRGWAAVTLALDQNGKEAFQCFVGASA